MKKIVRIVLLSALYCLSACGNQVVEHVTIAILAHNSAHTLPLYLACIEKQTWPADKTYLYVRTHNNRDATASILCEWIDKVRDRYAGIYYDDADVAVPSARFKVLGKIRQDSVQWARQQSSHYCVVDCDNFIKPHTIEALLNTHLPIVAPLLRTENTAYSNYHAAVDTNGYYADSPLYYQILRGEIRGLIELPVVLGTYVVRHEILDKILYDDETGRYDYAIFSDAARKQAIPQYLDTREIYGGISFAQDQAQLQESTWLTEVSGQNPQDRIFVYKKNVLHTFARFDKDTDAFVINEFSRWEKETFDVFDTVKDAHGIAIDLGAWIGTTAIWLSKNFHHVIAVDADQVSLRCLKMNLAASECNNVSVCDRPVAHTNKNVVFGPRGYALNGSISYVKNESDSLTDYVVQAITFKQLIDDYVYADARLTSHKISFIKCDIEGGEEDILEDILYFAHQNNIRVYISFHLDWWKSKKISDFEYLFSFFRTDCPDPSINNYMKQNPFGSILFEPRYDAGVLDRTDA
jgi:FkbM family methyltransferase